MSEIRDEEVHKTCSRLSLQNKKHNQKYLQMKLHSLQIIFLYLLGSILNQDLTNCKQRRLQRSDEGGGGLDHQGFFPSVLVAGAAAAGVGSRQISAPNTHHSPRFSLEPPAFVEYLNSTGTVIGCRPSTSVNEPPTAALWAQQATTSKVAHQHRPIQPKISWHLVRRLPGAEEEEQEGLQIEEEETISGGRVRPDGSLQLDAGRMTSPQASLETYKCCLSNRHGRLCSRPVRARAIADSPSTPVNLEVFDEFVLAGNSITLKCQAPGLMGRYLEPVAWLRDDKLILSVATNPLNYQPVATEALSEYNLRGQRSATQQIETAKFLMLVEGELLIRNASKQDAATYKCRAKHLITGQTVTSRIGGQLMVDDTRSKSELRPQEASRRLVSSQVDGDALLCAQVQSQPPAKFAWTYRGASTGAETSPLPTDLKPLGSCLYIKQVQLRHAGTYLCEATNGNQQTRSTFRLLVNSGQLNAQLTLVTQAPRPILAPSSNQQIVHFGTNTQLNCSVQGQTYDTITWYRNAQLLAIAHSFANENSREKEEVRWSLRVQKQGNKNIKLVQPNVISIESFGLRDRGTYQCQVYTAARMNTSRLATQSSLLMGRLEREHLRSASSAVQLELPLVKPTLVNKFTSQTVQSGEHLSIECGASALPSARFVWFLDKQPILALGYSGGDLPEVKSSRWTLSELLEPTTLDTQNYAAEQRDGFSSLEETDWWTLLGDLEAQQDAQDNILGPYDSPISDKRFQVNHQLLPGGQQSIVISQLNISQVSAADSGQYKCLALNALGSTWHSAQIGVSGGGLELRSYQSANVTLLAGSAGRLQCPLVGYPLQKIDWFWGEQRLPLNHRQRIDPIKSGFGGQLEISNVDRAADGGLYTCRASLASSSLSPGERYDDLVGIVNAIVRAPPLIDAQSLPELVQTTEGMRTKLVCSVVAGDRPVEIRWLRRTNEPARSSSQVVRFGSLKLTGYELMQNSASSSASEQDSITIHNLEDSCLLTFKQVDHADAAEYLCLAQNDVSHSARNTRLVVHVAPTWSREPSSEIGVLLGSRLQLDCAAHGYPMPQVSWRRESFGSQKLGEQLQSGTDTGSENFVEFVGSFRQRIQPNGSLTIEQVELSDSGAYMCELTNGVGTGLSKMIRVRVHAPPYFKPRTTPVTQLAQVGGRTELKCMAHGDQPMVIGWRKDTDIVDLINDSRHRVVSEHKLALGALESSLSLQNLMRNDSGQYVCMASNEFGTEESLVQLIVQEPPEAPNLLRPVRATSRQATLSFRPPYSGNSPIRRYSIYYKQLPLTDHPSKGDLLLVSDQHQPYFNSSSSTSGPLGAGWQQITVEAPLATPFSPSFNESASTLIQDGEQSARVNSLAGQLVNLNLCCLEPFARYVVRVRAINEIGQSELSKAAHFSTDEEAIGGPPLDVGVEATGAHSLKVRWRAPAKHLQNGLIRGYYIGYRATTSSVGPSPNSQRQRNQPINTFVVSPAAVSETLSSDNEQYQYKNVQLELAGLLAAPGSAGGGEQQALLAASSNAAHMPQVFTSYLTNLRRKTTYSIIVQAYNKVGAGPRSDQILVSTLDAAPPISPQLRVLSVSYNSAMMSWSARRRFSQGAAQHDQQSNTSLHRVNYKPYGATDELELDEDEMNADDDPQSYYTINYRADPLISSSGISHQHSLSDEAEWQQQKVQRRASGGPNYVLGNLRCGSRHTAYMTATNSLGQSEPGEQVKFATLGAAPVAPSSSRNLLEVNSTFVVLRLGSWQNAGCLISSFLIKFRPSNQMKWTILEHQVHPTIQTVTIAGAALFSTRPLSVDHQQFLSSDSLLDQQMRGNHLNHLIVNKQQNLNDLVVRNLLASQEYKLLVEATSEAGNTQAEYEFDTGNLTSTTTGVTVNGLSVQERAAASAAAAAAGAARGSRARDGPASLEDPLADLPSLSPEGPMTSSGGGGRSTSSLGWQRYTFGVWSLTVIFVVASACMAGTALVLGYRSLMRVKPTREGIMSTLLCCSNQSNASTAGSSAGDSSNSHASSTAGTCYQVPERSEAAAYLRCAAASQQHLHLVQHQQQQQQQGHYDLDQPLPLHIQQAIQDSLTTADTPAAADLYGNQRSHLVTSSSLSTIGGHLANSSSNSRAGQLRHTHTLASAAQCQAQLRRQQAINEQHLSATGDQCQSSMLDHQSHLRTQYAATLGKQYSQRNSSSSFINNCDQPLLKYNMVDQQQQQAPNSLYGRLQNQAISSFQVFQAPAVGSSTSGGTTSGYETGPSSSTKQVVATDLDDCQSNRNNYLQCLAPSQDAYQMTNLYGTGNQQANQRYCDNDQPDQSFLNDQNQQFHYNVPNVIQIQNKDLSMNCQQNADQQQQQQLAAYGMFFAPQDQQS